MKAFAWRRDVTVGQHGTNHDDAACAVMKAFQRQRVNRKVRLDCNRSSTFSTFFFFSKLFDLVHPPIHGYLSKSHTLLSIPH